MKLGIYGGTFNPPHLGHLTSARLALDALGRANDSLQTRFSPRINELAARYMSRLTGGLNLGGLF